MSREPEALREPIRLWPEEAPEALGAEDADIPTLTPFLAEPDKAAGGGCSHLDGLRGWPFAEWLNSIGMAGLVLDYRVASIATRRRFRTQPVVRSRPSAPRRPSGN